MQVRSVRHAGLIQGVFAKVHVRQEPPWLLPVVPAPDQPLARSQQACIRADFVPLGKDGEDREYPGGSGDSRDVA